ncbi:MAG: hypothetical protein K8F91_18950, partial [Candidatus Obscuribacterales bacterium]|nr:hypothetical protein [Candidatus Obscuribacterales bacterium]
MGPNETTWQKFLDSFKKFISDPPIARLSSAQAIAHNPSLKDLRATVLDGGGARIWLFPNIAENRVLFVQSITIPADATAAKIDVLDYPDSINISGARIVSSVTSTTQVVRGHKKTVSIQGPKYLIVSGNDRVTGLVWIKAFKPYNNTWVRTEDPFSAVPPYLIENVAGRAHFSGNNLVLSVAAPDDKPEKLPKPKSSSYEIVLKLVGGKYFLADGAQSASGPLPMISYFVQCLRNGRLDLAKAWLEDATLISIPKYAGLVGKTPQKPYKLVAMATPPTGAPRFRLVTYQKNDLIFDTGKSKNQWVIKGIFIAPSDPLAQQLNGTLVGQTASESSPP